MDHLDNHLQYYLRRTSSYYKDGVLVAEEILYSRRTTSGREYYHIFPLLLSTPNLVNGGSCGGVDWLHY